VQNFVVLNLKEKSMRYAFFKEQALKVKLPSKKSQLAAVAQSGLILALKD
jgi:hypothetical protein